MVPEFAAAGDTRAFLPIWFNRRATALPLVSLVSPASATPPSSATDEVGVPEPWTLECHLHCMKEEKPMPQQASAALVYDMVLLIFLIKGLPRGCIPTAQSARYCAAARNPGGSIVATLRCRSRCSFRSLPPLRFIRHRRRSASEPWAGSRGSTPGYFPTAFNTSTISVFSHGKSKSVLPKCP